jgi:hypothetical protein
MKNNIIAGMVSGLYLFTCIAQAQNYSEKEIALAYSNYKTDLGIHSTSENTEIVDYPTISYPETESFKVEKEKAFYHLSWEVLMRENLSYTEVQSSPDGINFNTVGFVTNDGSDYFVPSDNTNNMSYFRLIQYSVNAQKHTSEIMKVK